MPTITRKYHNDLMIDNISSQDFLTHLFSKIWNFIIQEKEFKEYFNHDEDGDYTPFDFYSDYVFELFKNLRKDFPFESVYPQVIGTIERKIRPQVMDFMAWFSNYKNYTSGEIFNKMNNQTFTLQPLEKLKQVVINSNMSFKYSYSEFDRNLNKIFAILDRFRSISSPLLKRRKGKQVLKIKNEYDVQDILHVILKSIFPSVRCEEVVSTLSRRFLKIDFLLLKEKIAIECKYIRDSNHAKNFIVEIDNDIRPYSKHRDVSTLIIFVYDDNLFISDPNYLEKEYSMVQKFRSKSIRVFLRVRPKN